MKLKLMVATVKVSRKTKTSVGSLWVSTAPLGFTLKRVPGTVVVLNYITTFCINCADFKNMYMSAWLKIVLLYITQITYKKLVYISLL